MAAGGEGESVFGLAVMFYLFLGGTGAGACVVLLLAGLREQTRAGCRLLASGYAAAFAVLLLGALCLVCDLEHPERMMALVLSPAPTYLVVGAYALAACLVLSGVLALAWRGHLRALGSVVVRALSVACALVACVVAVYTGLLLATVKAVPLWNSWLVPVLFAASALSCGIALVALTARLCGVIDACAHAIARLLRADAVAIACEAVAAAALLAHLAAFGGADATSALAPVAAGSAQTLIAGDAAWLFWGGFVACGLVVPLVIDGALALRRVSLESNAVVALAVVVLLGGLALRVCMVEAGFSLAWMG